MIYILKIITYMSISRRKVSGLGLCSGDLKLAVMDVRYAAGFSRHAL